MALVLLVVLLEKLFLAGSSRLLSCLALAMSDSTCYSATIDDFSPK